MYLFRFTLLCFLLLSPLVAYPNYSTAMKEKKLYPMGAKLYEKKCPNISLAHYKKASDLENDIYEKNICGKLSHKYADALFLYLWEIKKEKNNQKKYPKLTVTKTDKCPVCGMFLYKYPRWVSRIVYNDGQFSFDGIKDMMKYYFEHQENIKVVLVQEYYSQETINAREAFFVLGSDVYGPMGNELIAFKDIKSAKRFSLDHRGKKILKFAEITEDAVYKLDE